LPAPSRSVRGSLISLKSFVLIMNIIESDFRGLDLNLLPVFHALLLERSVTRAAGRLFMGQPAVSGALKRLRAAFADELFVRTSHGMRPTPRALELARAIDPLLLSLQQALRNQSSFEPSTSTRVFRIGLTDALEVALMPQIMLKLSKIAPGVGLISRSTDAPRVIGMLDSSEIEIALGVFPERPSWQQRRDLFRWRFVCVFNPQLVKIGGKKLSMAQYLRYPHVITSFSGGLRGFIDEELEKRKLHRRVVFSSPNFATSPFIVQRMPALTTVPTFIAAAWFDALGLEVRPLPFPVPEFQVSLLWTAANEADAGLRWLRSLLADVFSPAEHFTEKERI